VGHAHDAIQIVTNYDVNIVCPLLLELFFHLNLVKAVVDQLIVVEDEDLFFGQIVSNDDVIMSTLKNELQLYQQLVDIENLLIWWEKHVIQVCMFLSLLIKSLVFWDHRSKLNGFLMLQVSSLT
jgi:hypothetical protein